MLNKLDGYCNSIKLDLYKAVENSIGYKGLIDDKNFTITIANENEYIVSIADDLLFTAFCTVLQAKYRTLLTHKRNVKLLGKTRPYNLVQFTCQKETKVKQILGQVERIYFELLKEKKEKVGN